MMEDFRRRFALIAAQTDSDIRLDEAALLVAAEAENNLPIEDYLKTLDDYADGFRSLREGYGGSITSLINYIHNELGFSGNISDYYDPANSYLNRVIENRQGIPITLALIHLAIGSRLGIPVCGISFPGHFLVRYGDHPGTIVDPFSGRELSRTDCETLIRQIAGPKATLKDEYFKAATSREILIRMLDNLKQIFWRAKKWGESKSCIDRQLLLLPNREELSVQLGALYEMQGNRALAQHTYIRVLQAAKDQKLREIVSKRLLALEAPPSVFH